METTRAFAGLACRDCGESVDAETGSHRCPACDGPLDPEYDYVDIDLTRDDIENERFDSMWRYADLLPFDRSDAVSIGEGATPLVAAPSLAERMGVDRVLVKDESRNPTGSIADRELAVTATAARFHEAATLALASTGNDGQSASAYAAAAQLDSEVYVPSRTGFTSKAMVNVHGGEMTVTEGRFPDAAAAFQAELAEAESWYPVGAFETPYRHEGLKTLAYEVIEQLDWTSPDAVVYPTGEGTGLVGFQKGASEFRDLGLVDDEPALYAAQAEGCAPIVRAIEEERSAIEAWQQPDTICGDLEIPDPRGESWVLEAIRESGGGGVSTDDEAILEAGTQIAQSAGLEPSPSAAAAVSGAIELAENGAFEESDTVVLISTATGNKEADVLRSHLMRKGI